MTRVILTLLALFLLIIIYAASPYSGLYRILSAVQTRDAAALSKNVDFSHLRQSLTSQIIENYLKLTGRSERLGQFGSSMAVGIGTAIAEPILSQMLNPEGLIALLQNGRVNVGPQPVAVQLGPLSNNSLGSFWDAVRNSDYGLGRFFISLPTSAPPQEQFRLELQLLEWRWKLTAITLPEQLRMGLATELAKQNP
jgi:hypothetical protein